jgi:DNA-binding response OmpR family regulator
MTNLSYAHLRILIVEDQHLVSESMKQDLQRMGVLVIGPASSVSTALRMLDAAPIVDGAILDIDLHGETSFPIADALRERDVPFVFSSGYDERLIPEPYQDVTRCEKPADVRTMVEAILA